MIVRNPGGWAEGFWPPVDHQQLLKPGKEFAAVLIFLARFSSLDFGADLVQANQRLTPERGAAKFFVYPAADNEMLAASQHTMK